MRPKELRIVVTFETTTAAMAFEAAARRQKVAGRLIPIPREITAECGLSFSAPPGERETVKSLADKMDCQEIYELII